MVSRSSRALRQLWLSGLLAAGVAAAALWLASPLRVRVDLTSGGQYTLAPATVELLESLDDLLQVRLYFSQDLEGTEELLPVRIIIRDLLEEMQAVSGGRMQLETLDPAQDPAALFEAGNVGIAPIPLAGQSRTSLSVTQLYQGLTLSYAGGVEVIPMAFPDRFEFTFDAALSELLRDEEPVIGIFSREPPAPPRLPGVPAPPAPPGRDYSELRELIEARFAWRDVEPGEDADLSGLAALLVLRPENVTAAERAALDRYLVQGGRLVLFLDYEQFGGVEGTREFETGLTDWLAGHGVTVGGKIVFDSRGAPTRVPVRVDRGGGRRQQAFQQVVNGLWPLLEGPASLATAQRVTASLRRLVLLVAHPVFTDEREDGLARDWLLRSSERSWLLPEDVPLEATLSNLQNLTAQAVQTGAARAYDLGVVLSGRFPALAEHAEPLEPAPGLLVVVGDSDLLRNGVVQSDNRDFAANLVDWLAQDESLIAMRARGREDRSLRDFEAEWLAAHGVDGESADEEALQAAIQSATAHERDTQRLLAWANVLLPPGLVLLLGIGHWAFWRRRARVPFRPAEEA